MTPERWQQIEQLYHAALEREENQRAAYLQEVCTGDDALRREVESLLAQERQGEGFLESPALEVAARAMAKDSRETLNRRQLGAYKIVSLLGAGGMGEVYQGRDGKLNRDVAIKVLPTEFVHDAERLARFQREARMLASLNHPNIATIHGLERSDGTHYLVMELVCGQTLEERIRGGRMRMEEGLKLAVQIAEALEAAHEKGVIHRDLKPANVKVTPEGRVKVLDFGLAKAFAGDSGLDLSNAPTLTAMGTEEGRILGTPAYMSPEQARGKPVDKRTDIWAFGCVLYEMLTGKAAFRGETVSDTIAAVLEREPDWQMLPPATPANIRELLRRCLQKDSPRRLRDIGDARIEIEEALAAPAVAEPSAPAKGVRALGRRALLLSLGALLLGGAIIGLATWHLKPSPSPQPVTRLTITLPPGQELGPTATNSVAISEDGKNLVYGARQQGVLRLYLRALNSFEAIPISGTEGGKAPFLSPDGHWVGFFSEGKLKKIPTAGGVASTLCDSPSVTGGYWGSDGWIYFSPRDTSEIWRVSVDGGALEPVTALDSKQGEWMHLWPQLLPGGKAILFTVWTGPAVDDSHLAVQVLGTDRHRIVVRGASGGGQYVSSGHLVYVRGGRLMTVPFDIAHLEVTADVPVEIVKGVLEGTNTAHFSVSSGGTLAFAPGSSAVTAETRLVWVDRGGKAEPLAAPARVYRNVHISPDGRRIVVGTFDNAEELWIYDPARNTLNRLNTSPGSAFPLWTPDGNLITFQIFHQGLYRRRADGSGEEELITASNNEKEPSSWSPDGRILAYGEEDPKTRFDIWTVDMEGDRKPRPFLKTPYDERGPVISPDGRWIAYASDESGRSEIYVQPFPTPGRKWQISTDGGTLPTWARNGNELFYRDPRGEKMMAVDTRAGSTFTAGLPHMLFAGNYYTWAGRTYDVSPDSKRFLMLQPVGEEQAPTQINVVLNWFEELKRRVPAKQ